MFNNPKKQMPNDEKDEKTQEKKPKWDKEAKTSYIRMFKMMGTPNPAAKIAADIKDSDGPEQTVKTGQTAGAENPKITPAKIKK